MRLHRLTLTAFGPFGTAQHVDFDRLSAAGLFLFHGATGAGKSSILDAVCFALYGSVPGARQQATLALRSDHAAPGIATEVVLDLTVGGRRLEITRAPEQDRPKRRGTGTTRERARALLREHDPVTGAWRALSRSHQEIGEELAGLLGGMSREQFCQVVLLPQGEFARFLRAGAEERAKLLGRLFGTHRFAAAEAHLAEQRTAAAQRVRAADERLLALTNRVLQAAGPDAAELGPAPAPQDAPVGTDPAQPLLGWAAQARCTARERHTIATLALEHAEAAHAAAERRHTETAERARLQREHARARERAAALAAGEPAHAADVARLDRAQAAESVAPALGLRATADAEHRAAILAEREARAALPPDLADSPAAVLADRERAAREALGALAAARAAEARAGAITAELAALAEEAAADEASLVDAESRLAPWPAEAERLRHDLERVLAAAATADAVAQRLMLAGDRLAAAHRRDRLSAELIAAGEALLAAREAAADAYAHWLDLKERRLRDIAAELAAALRPGRPCPVCGAEEHPGPARPTSDHVDRAAEEAARTAHQAAERHRAQADQDLAALRADHAAAAAEAGDEPAEALAGTVRDLEAELAAARAEAAGEAAARQAVVAAEAAHARLLDQRGAAERRGAARASRQAALTTELTTLRAEVDRARADAPTVADRAAALTRRAEALAAAAAAARAAQETADRRKQADDRLADAAYRAGFDSPRAAAEAALPECERAGLRRRVDAWRAERAAVAAALADPAATAAAAEPPADPEATRAALTAAAGRLRAAATAESVARARRAELDALSATAAADATELAPLRLASRRITRLAGLAAGTSPENEYRMRLETYVLAARLEQVAAVASTRLHRMSAGRYTLVHTDARAAHRARSGLGLLVMDAWTGRTRDTATLSGGESFFVSLALALGLADVVAEEAGGPRLDTLFVDEGFGSLDEQSLDEVLDVLDGLREHDRSVAIVSHVPDLRARIPAQLEVVKTRHGSTVRHRTG